MKIERYLKKAFVSVMMLLVMFASMEELRWQ